LLLAFSFFGVCLWLVSEDEATALDHWNDFHDRVGRIFRAQAISSLAFTGALPDLQRKPSFQWLAIAGLSFSAMIVNSYYTSGITASRFFQAIDNQGVSITDVIAGQSKICGMAPIRSAFVFRFPDVEKYGLWVTVADMPELLQGMDEGKCSYAIFTPEWWEYVKAGYWEYPHYDDVRRAHTHCKNKIPIPLGHDQSVSMPVAMPVRKEFQAPLSYIVSKAYAEGRYHGTLGTAKQNRLTAGGGSITTTCGSAGDVTDDVVLDVSTAMAPCFVVILSGLLAVAGHFLWKHKLQRMEQRMEHAFTTAGADARRTIGHTASSVGADARRSRKPGTLKTSSWRAAASVRLQLPRAAPGSTGSPGIGRCDSGSSDKPNPEMPLNVTARFVSKASALKRARPAKGREGQGDDHMDILPDDADNGVDFDRQLLQQLTKLNDRLDQLVPTQPTHGHSVQYGAPLPEEGFEVLSTLCRTSQGIRAKKTFAGSSAAQALAIQARDEVSVLARSSR